jgi:hypothetical protein
VNHEVSVTEGNDNRLQLSVVSRGTCLIRFFADAWMTASGDVSAIAQSKFTTDNGSNPGLRLLPCTVSAEMVTPTIATAGYRGARTVHFDIQPDSDERTLRKGGRETVRYTVHIDDADGTALQSAAVDVSSLSLTYDKALAESGTISPSNVIVKVNGSPGSVSSVSVSGTTVTLTLAQGRRPRDAHERGLQGPWSGDSRRLTARTRSGSRTLFLRSFRRRSSNRFI